MKLLSGEWQSGLGGVAFAVCPESTAQAASIDGHRRWHDSQLNALRRTQRRDLILLGAVVVLLLVPPIWALWRLA